VPTLDFDPGKMQFCGGLICFVLLCLFCGARQKFVGDFLFVWLVGWLAFGFWFL
jgi:hypothetical protein